MTDRQTDRHPYAAMNCDNSFCSLDGSALAASRVTQSRACGAPPPPYCATNSADGGSGGRFLAARGTCVCERRVGAGETYRTVVAGVLGSDDREGRRTTGGTEIERIPVDPLSRLDSADDAEDGRESRTLRLARRLCDSRSRPRETGGPYDCEEYCCTLQGNQHQHTREISNNTQKKPCQKGRTGKTQSCQIPYFISACKSLIFFTD